MCPNCTVYTVLDRKGLKHSFDKRSITLCYITLHVSRLDNTPTLYLLPNNSLTEQNGDDGVTKHMAHSLSVVCFRFSLCVNNDAEKSLLYFEQIIHHLTPYCLLRNRY